MKAEIVKLLESYLTDELHGKSNTIHRVNFRNIAEKIEEIGKAQRETDLIRFGKFVRPYSPSVSIELILEKWKQKN